jgi:hypothetical protein
VTLADARAEVEQIVKDTAQRAAPGLPVTDDPGLGDLHCDPQGSGLMDYQFRQVIEVSDEDLDEIVEAAWAYWQELGFEGSRVTLRDMQPSVNARRGKMLGELIGDRGQSTVYIAVTTPCLREA